MVFLIELKNHSKINKLKDSGLSYEKVFTEWMAEGKIFNYARCDREKRFWLFLNFQGEQEIYDLISDLPFTGNMRIQLLPIETRQFSQMYKSSHFMWN